MRPESYIAKLNQRRVSHRKCLIGYYGDNSVVATLPHVPANGFLALCATDLTIRRKFSILNAEKSSLSIFQVKFAFVVRIARLHQLSKNNIIANNPRNSAALPTYSFLAEKNLIILT